MCRSQKLVTSVFRDCKDLGRGSTFVLGLTEHWASPKPGFGYVNIALSRTSLWRGTSTLPRPLANILPEVQPFKQKLVDRNRRGYRWVSIPS